MKANDLAKDALAQGRSLRQERRVKGQVEADLMTPPVEYVGSADSEPLLRPLGGKAVKGRSLTNGAIEPGVVATDNGGGLLRADGMPYVRRDPKRPIPPRYGSVLFLLDVNIFNYPEWAPNFQSIDSSFAQVPHLPTEKFIEEIALWLGGQQKRIFYLSERTDDFGMSKEYLFESRCVALGVQAVPVSTLMDDRIDSGLYVPYLTGTLSIDEEEQFLAIARRFKAIIQGERPGLKRINDYWLKILGIGTTQDTLAASAEPIPPGYIPSQKELVDAILGKYFEQTLAKNRFFKTEGIIRSNATSAFTKPLRGRDVAIATSPYYDGKPSIVIFGV